MVQPDAHHQLTICVSHLSAPGEVTTCEFYQDNKVYDAVKCKMMKNNLGSLAKI